MIEREAELMSSAEVAEWLGVFPSTVKIWVQEGRLPKPVQWGKVIRWERSALEQMIAAAEREAEREAFYAAEALAWKQAEAGSEALATEKREAKREAAATLFAANPGTAACPTCGHRADDGAILFEDSVECQFPELADNRVLYQLLGVSDSGQVLLRPVRVAPPKSGGTREGEHLLTAQEMAVISEVQPTDEVWDEMVAQKVAEAETERAAD